MHPSASPGRSPAGDPTGIGPVAAVHSGLAATVLNILCPGGGNRSQGAPACGEKNDSNNNLEGNDVSPTKIAIWIGVAAAVVSAFVQIPYIGVVLLVVGLYVGSTCGADESIRLGVGAVVLTHFAGNFDAVPVAGSYLHAIVASLGAVGAGAAVSRVLMNVWSRATA